MNDFDEQPAHKHTAEEEKKGQRFRGDLDYFRFSSFKSQHHLSNPMLDDFVEIYSNKTHAAKTISCCFHYLMHLQSGKRTRKKISQGGKKTSHIISLQKCEQTTSEMGGYKQTRWYSMFFVFLYHPYHYREPSFLHTAPYDPYHAPLLCVSLKLPLLPIPPPFRYPSCC